MAYRDKEKQREACKLAMQRKRQGITQAGITEQGITCDFKDCDVIPDLEYCCACGEPLFKLEKPRRSHGMCLPCVTAGKKAPWLPPRKVDCFEDLPPDVQADIEMMARARGDYEQERKDRTARAIGYQHMYPDRWYPYGRTA